MQQQVKYFCIKPSATQKRYRVEQDLHKFSRVNQKFEANNYYFHCKNENSKTASAQTGCHIFR